MASLAGRLRRLEEQRVVAPSDTHAGRLFYERLTYQELLWLSEPGEQAQERVPCPHAQSAECICRGEERQMRGFEAYPELREESERRYRVLASLERREEILAREPEDPAKGGGTCRT